MIRLDRLTEDECECFRSRCNFTEDERRAFDLRAKGKSRIEISSSLAVMMWSNTVLTPTPASL